MSPVFKIWVVSILTLLHAYVAGLCLDILLSLKDSAAPSILLMIINVFFTLRGFNQVRDYAAELARSRLDG